jgi:hypothetical protein
MAGTAADKVQRGHNFAIVDEVDSILIDEARTPLIISGRLADAAKLYYRFASVVRSLKRDVDYEVEEDKRVVVPLEAGIEKVEQALGIDNLYDEVQQNLVHQLAVALKAKELYKRDKDYIVANGEVKIVDDFRRNNRNTSAGIKNCMILCFCKMSDMFINLELSVIRSDLFISDCGLYNMFQSIGKSLICMEMTRDRGIVTTSSIKASSSSPFAFGP